MSCKIYVIEAISSTKMNHESRMETPSLAGKTCVVTGGTAGLGKQTVLSLAAKHAANVVFTGRNAKRAQEVIDEVKARYAQQQPSKLSTY